ncbi:MAG: hypothetical protein PHQ19_04875 [Candidatus Krumholzibacteria bacterium]|nr:hypothetical protein [Candidatus Krumholzibacteria bacterium]
MNRFLAASLAVMLAALVAAPAAAGDEPAYGFKFSGFFKADAIYDDASIYPGNYRFWVNPYGETKDNEFFMTANESRIGLDFWWKEETFTTSAKLEFDFYGLAAAENKSQVLLRHAYVQMKGEQWSFLAGQTSDIISPLVAKTANYTVLWNQGNIGYRRPQMRGALWTPMGDDATIKIDAGISRNIFSDLDGDKLDDGADAGFPTVQGRLGLDSKFGDGNALAVGAWGHFGQSVYGPEDSLSVDSWSVGADLSVTISKKVTLMGEFFTGQALGQYLGGIGQSTTPMNEALPSMGGWGMISLKAADKVTLNLGYGFDDPDEEEWKAPDDGEAYTLKDMNSEVFGNLMYDITGNVQAMIEVAMCKTEYLTRAFGEDDVTADYDAMRFQFAIKAAIK